MSLHRDIHSSSILRAFFDPTPRYVRETPCYRFYATSLMKKRNNRFRVCQKPWQPVEKAYCSVLRRTILGSLS